MTNNQRKDINKNVVFSISFNLLLFKEISDN